MAHYRATGKRTLLDVAVKLADYIDKTLRARQAHGRARPRGDRTGPGQALPGDRREAVSRSARVLPRHPRRQRRRRTRSTARTSRTTCRSASRARSSATRSGRCTSTAAWPTWPRTPATRASSTPWTGSGTTWSRRKMYVTGGIGARHEGEAFGDPYELPNESAYCETCAAIGLALWNHRLNLMHGDAKYADVLERALYNGIPLRRRPGRQAVLLRQSAGQRRQAPPPAVLRLRLLPDQRGPRSALAAGLRLRPGRQAASS